MNNKTLNKFEMKLSGNKGDNTLLLIAAIGTFSH